ncbi:MAG: hypothetical protein AABX33_05745 [Nanoarchaeota archaeon]
MEEDYDWKLILKVSVPFALVSAFLFYISISNAWKWLSMTLASFLAGGIIYMKDKKKSNIFTAMGIVFLVALVVRFMRNFGFI